MAPGKEKPVVTPDAAAVRAQVEAEMAQKREALGNTIAPSDAPRQNPSDSAQQRERALAAQRTALVDLERDVDGAIANDRADATTSTLPDSSDAGSQTTPPQEEFGFKAMMKNYWNELKVLWHDTVGDKPSELWEATKEGFHEMLNSVRKFLGMEPLADKAKDKVPVVEGPSPEGVEMVPMSEVVHPDAKLFSFVKGVRTMLTSPYGHRVAPPTKDGRHGSDNHGGVDIGCPEGSKIVCMMDGVKVLYASRDVRGNNTGAGNYLLLELPNGEPVYLMHLKEVPAFKPGTILRKGMVMAISGNTGNSSGPHLHFQVGHKGKTENPEQWLHPDYHRQNEDRWVG